MGATLSPPLLSNLRVATQLVQAGGWEKAPEKTAATQTVTSSPFDQRLLQFLRLDFEQMVLFLMNLSARLFQFPASTEISHSLGLLRSAARRLQWLGSTSMGLRTAAQTRKWTEAWNRLELRVPSCA